MLIWGFRPFLDPWYRTYPRATQQPFLEAHEGAFLERYFARPQTVDRIRASWVGPAIEQCATWLIERGHAARNLARYVPIQMHVGKREAEQAQKRKQEQKPKR